MLPFISMGCSFACASLAAGPDDRIRRHLLTVTTFLVVLLATRLLGCSDSWQRDNLIIAIVVIQRWRLHISTELFSESGLVVI